MGRIDCSQALNYSSELERMCDCYELCKLGCPLYELKECCDDAKKITQEKINIVQKWSDEHPVRDFKQELLALKIVASDLNSNDRFKDTSFNHYGEPMDGADIPELLFNLIERLEKGGAEHDR